MRTASRGSCPAFGRPTAPSGFSATTTIGPGRRMWRLRREGVELLLNRHRLIRRGGAVVAVGGVDDFAHGAVRVDEALDGVPPGVPRVLVSHNPDLIGYLPADIRVDL